LEKEFDIEDLSRKFSENEEIYSFLNLLGKKDIELRKKEFEVILNLIEKEFDIDSLEKIEDNLNNKKEKKFNLIDKKLLNENKENNCNKNNYQKYVSVKKINFCEDNYNYLLANKKKFGQESISLEDNKEEENKDDFNNFQLDKSLTKNKLYNIENKIKNYLLCFQKENFFKKKIFMNFVEEDPLIKSRKNMHANPSIIKCFFEEEAVISAKKRHSLLDNNLKNQLDKVIQNRNCVSNKNEDDFILKQKELARKRSNISDFDMMGNNNNIDNHSSNDNSSEDDNNDNNNVKMIDFGNNNNRKGSTSSGNTTPKLRLSKRGSILRDRLSKLNFNLMVVKEEENNVNICNSDNESGSSESDEKKN
jgi:hypothetical protein